MGLIITSRIPTEGSSSSTYTDGNSIDTSIYRMLSVPGDLKTYNVLGRPKNEFEQFIKDAEAKTSGVVNAPFDNLDLYLGSLGVTDARIY